MLPRVQLSSYMQLHKGPREGKWMLKGSLCLRQNYRECLKPSVPAHFYNARKEEKEKLLICKITQQLHCIVFIVDVFLYYRWCGAVDGLEGILGKHRCQKFLMLLLLLF